MCNLIPTNLDLGAAWLITIIKINHYMLIRIVSIHLLLFCYITYITSLPHKCHFNFKPCTLYDVTLSVVHFPFTSAFQRLRNRTVP